VVVVVIAGRMPEIVQAVRWRGKELAAKRRVFIAASVLQTQWVLRTVWFAILYVLPLMVVCHSDSSECGSCVITR
jgi:hypothetical protein